MFLLRSCFAAPKQICDIAHKNGLRSDYVLLAGPTIRPWQAKYEFDVGVRVGVDGAGWGGA